MSRLEHEGEGLPRAGTYEFLPPEAFTFGVYRRSDENPKAVLSAAGLVGKLGKKLFSRT